MAIAFDSTSNCTSSTGGSPNTWTHTCSGTDRILYVVAMCPPDSGPFTGVSVTYAGTPMTEIGHVSVSNSTSDWYISTWYLINPATGANTVSLSSSNSLAGTSISYTGCRQSGVPEGTAVSTNSGGSTVTTQTFTSTVVDTNSWQILGVRAMTTGWTAGTGTTLRATSLNGYFQVYDSNGPLSSGSKSLIMNGSSAKVGGVISSFAPTAVANYSNFFMLM